ncbi:MAG: ThiF family adenylyltransferase [Bacteroidota bacterium]|jgi:tRNA A37 threonylcarbamoyladenosine dehydratase
MAKEIKSWMGRSQLLMGEAHLQKLIHAHVLVVGLGGVGGIAAEMVARSGVGKMTIVDADTVEETNRNRQLPALISTDGQLKSDVMAKRLLDINPELELNVISKFFKDDTTTEILDAHTFDYALDCIDTLAPKVFFIKQCMERKIPIVSSMGAGNKIDPTQVRVADISRTYNCHLAKYTRKYLYKFGIRKGLKVVFSPEQPAEYMGIKLVEGQNKKSSPGTISYMPAIFGCTVASVAIRDLYLK